MSSMIDFKNEPVKKIIRGESVNAYSPHHPHEPEVDPVLDPEGRCLVCAFAVREREVWMKQLRAALEDRERLWAAAEAVYVDEAGFCHGLGKLRAALESRDG